MCVFSHDNAAEVFKHYRKQHPARKLSLEYISTYLYVGPDASRPKKKKPQRKRTDGISDGGGTDGSLLSQRFGQTETKTYSCRACSFKGSSMSIITRHYHAVHPWSVKEDGSVLNVITSKKPSAGSHVEDRSEMPASSDTYQVPLEFGESPGPCHEAAASPAMIKCHYCPAKFHTHRGLQTHCGMKHQEAVAESSDEPQEQQVPIKTRVHVFKCPYCTYVNTNYQGVLTHCQMKHSGFVSRADSLHVDETCLNSLDGCLKRKGPGDSLKFSGYMCKTCSQIYATPEKLNKHCESDHDESVPNTRQPAPKPPSSKIQQPKTHSTLGSVSKPSFLRKKIYAVVRCQHCNYSCSTKIALSRHVRVHHRNASVSKVQDCVFKCVLCSSFYFTKKRLGSHYTKKHGRDAFLKYFTPVHKQVPEKSELPSPDCPATQLPENSPKATTDENKLLVYKCPSCTYVNASYHGTLTHCQMKHPAVIARADGLKTEEILTANIVGYTKGKGSNERGYMCKTCPQIHATLMSLKIHCQEDHNQAEPAASEHAAETETEEQPDRSPQGSASEAASLKNQTSAASTAETDLSQQQDSPERGQVSVQNTAALYKCHMCTYTGTHRKYLYCHYKKTHRLDAFSTFKLLEKYNKRKRKFRSLPAAASEERAHVKCKKCPDLTFGSSQLLIAHYSTFHSSDCKLDFTVLSQIREKSTGIYKCCHCRKQLNGIRNLCRHLDRHRAWRLQKKTAAETKASFVVTTTPETTPTEVCRQDEVPMLETVEELNQWIVRPAETFTLPTSPLSVHSKPTDLEQPELEPREEKHTCNQCRRKFMSLKGLRLHERSHAALAAIKKLPTSALKNNINQYVLYKAGTVRPFLCSFCSYRTTVLGLWRSHFMKKHQDVIKDPLETDNQDEENSERANKELHHLSEEKNCFPESDEEPEMTETSLYLEPPDVQRQLNHYSLMAQTVVSSKRNLQETALPDNRLLHCEFCNFNTGHLSSVRRHYLNRHGKKILRCKDCDFFTGLRKTLEMHMESCHTTCQSEATHQKDLRCPLCLYQTKNKNNMIDHIVLHREERVVPIEVRRPKLSRYLQGIVFRCHKCTFTSGSAENLRLHMSRHNDIKPYKCRLCYFDCTLLSDLEAHLSDKHQVVRNHELVGQVSLDQLEARVGRRPEEEEEEGEEERLSDLQHHNNGSEGLEKEDFVTDSNEVLHETRAENVALQIKEACEKPEQDPGPRTEDKTQQNAGKGNSADTHSGQCSDPERERQTKENQAQPKVRGGENSSTIFTQQKEEAAAGSSTTYGKIAEQTEALKLNIKAIQHRTMNNEARVEDDILRQILVLDKDGRKKADRTRAVKIEQSVETKEVDGTRSELPDDEGRIALARNPKNHMQANNIRIQESLKIGKHLLTLLPNCAKLKLKIRHKDNLRVSFTNCKEEQVRNQKTSQEATDPYGEMPVLENEYLKEETQLLTCCKEEEEGDHLEQQEEHKEAEAMTEDNEVRCKDQGNEEGDEIKEADGPRVHKSTFTTTSGTAEVLSPSVTENKLHTCEFCGRNLMNSSELKRHVMRHGI